MSHHKIRVRPNGMDCSVCLRRIRHIRPADVGFHGYEIEAEFDPNDIPSRVYRPIDDVACMASGCD